MSLGFPTTGLVANVTTYLHGGRTWIWTGSAWQLQSVLNGYVGSQGYWGSVGYFGSTGYWGSVGDTGYTGSQGIQGVRGLQGNSIKGDPGFAGSQGPSGAYAALGYAGSKGDVGYAGSAGSGYTGSFGFVGYTGSIGAGYVGSQGVPGAYSAVGYTGSIGPTGSPGGYTGSAAYMGSRGYAGSAGPGYTGSQGIPYIGGTTGTVLVNDSGYVNSYAGFTFSRSTNTLSVANTLVINTFISISRDKIDFSNSQIIYFPVGNNTIGTPVGTTDGAVRYNTDFKTLEIYNTSGSRWLNIGSTDIISSQSIIVYDDYHELTITPTSLFAGNSTVNTSISSTGLSTDDPYSNTTISSQLVFVGNTSANAAINLNGGQQTLYVSYYSVSAGGIATIQTQTNHGLQGVKGISGKISSTGFYYIDTLSSFVISDFGTVNTFSFSLTSAKTASNLRITSLGRTNGFTTYYTAGDHHYNVNDVIAITGIASTVEKGPYNFDSITIISTPSSSSFIIYDPSKVNYTANIIAMSNDAYDTYYKGPVYLKFTLDSPHDLNVGDSIFLDIPYAYSDYIMYSNGDSLKGIILRDPDDPEDPTAYTKNYRIEVVPSSDSFEVIAFYKNRNTSAIDSFTLPIAPEDIGTVQFFTDRDLDPVDITTAAYGSIPVVLNIPTYSTVLLTSPIYISVSNTTSITKITPASFFLGTPGGNNITIESSGTKFNTRGSYLQTFITGRGISIASLQEEDGQVLPEASAFFANSSVISIGNTQFTTILSSNSITTTKITAGSTDKFVSIDNNQFTIADTTSNQNTVITSYLADFGGDVSLLGDLYVGNKIYANGVFGANNQALYSNSTGGVYWSDAGVGYTGSSGYIGIDGYTGSIGYAGSIGSGYVGSKGYAGSRGTGFVGSRGYWGSLGYVGSQGDFGYTGSQGDLGYTGSVGYAGSIGYVGSQGVPGEYAGMGYVGSQGDLGYSGSIGYSGSQGIAGEYAALGFDGSQGKTGYVGSEGYVGSRGWLGARGWTGSRGAGYTGSTGYDGSEGYWGSIGYVGSQGIPGEYAALGYAGSQGDTGYTGSDGPQGIPGEYAALGYVGSQGELGYSGSQGYWGSTGYVGSQGVPGEYAALGYAGSKGEIGYSGSQGIPGAFIARGYAGSAGNGYDGSRGDLGYAGSIGYSGSQGIAGEYAGKGYDGSRGATGYVGSQGDLGYAGSQGDRGEPGEYAGMGFDGSQGEIGYTGSQGIAGEFAALGYAGSQGETGYVGSEGYTGSQGIPGEYAALGYAGSEGYRGSDGYLGSTGYDGSQGYWGSKGYSGSRGRDGLYAALGYQGSQGDIGYTGSQGIPGEYAALGYTGSQGAGFTGSRGVIGYSGSNGGFINGESIEVNDIVVDGQLIANNSSGIHGQVLTSNGIGIYWANSGASFNIDGGDPTSNYGGINPIDGGGI